MNLSVLILLLCVLPLKIGNTVVFGLSDTICIYLICEISTNRVCYFRIHFFLFRSTSWKILYTRKRLFCRIPARVVYPVCMTRDACVISVIFQNGFTV